MEISWVFEIADILNANVNLMIRVWSFLDWDVVNEELFCEVETDWKARVCTALVATVDESLMYKAHVGDGAPRQSCRLSVRGSRLYLF